MASDPTTEKPFTVQFIESNCQAIVDFASGFEFDNWSQFMDESRTWLAAGCVNWDLDLRRLQYINSMFIGSIVRLNGLLASRKGLLRIVVEPDSRLAQIFYIAKLQRIITIHEAPRRNDTPSPP